MERMKPCPFCGASANLWAWNGGARVDCSKWKVTNGNEHYVGIGAKTAEEAIRLWNERSNDEYRAEDETSKKEQEDQQERHG